MVEKTIMFKSKKIMFTLIEAGDDIIFIETGGDGPHVGAVSIAVPRPSLREHKQLSSTVSTYVLVGHKDDIIANEIAHEISKRTNKNVVAIVGVHYDKISEKDIKFIIKKSRTVCQEFIKSL